MSSSSWSRTVARLGPGDHRRLIHHQARDIRRQSRRLQCAQTPKRVARHTDRSTDLVDYGGDVLGLSLDRVGRVVPAVPAPAPIHGVHGEVRLQLRQHAVKGGVVPGRSVHQNQAGPVPLRQ